MYKLFLHSSGKYPIYRGLVRHSIYFKRHTLKPYVTVVACNSSLANCNYV